MKCVRRECQACKAWGECHWSIDPIRRLCRQCHEDLVGPLPLEASS